MLKKALLSISISVFFVSTLHSQDNVARLTSIIGSHIEFNFNSLDKIFSGIRIDKGTTLAITMEDLTGGTMTGWHIDVQSWMAQPTINASGGQTIPLNAIQVEATDANGNLATATFNGLQDLAIAPGFELMNTIDPLHIPADANTHQIDISYECGIANGDLSGYIGGYYTVEIEIILIPDF